MKLSLEESQKEIMKEFYGIKPTKVIFNKRERKRLWGNATSRSSSFDFSTIDKVCPALSHQVSRSYSSGNNIQSAVFSECVYAQTIANMLDLDEFHNSLEGDNILTSSVEKLLKSYNLFPRYVYSNKKRDRLLVQAGGCKGIDSALINVNDLKIYTIEFKEPYAKTTEPDLPKVGEDGKLFINKEFVEDYPQFEEMLKEHVGLNIFDHMGENIHNFSLESINIAVSENYTKKYADVICTEDSNGNLVMIPVNQVSIWAKLEGEIRATGRNFYKVWTPNTLKKFLNSYGAEINGNNVKMLKSKMIPRKQRGGHGKISGYKINPLFFVEVKYCESKGLYYVFPFDKIKQIDPTITAKMKFSKLKYKEVKEYYLGLI